MEYLGFTLDSISMTVSLTDVKYQKLKTLIDETLQSKKLVIKQTAKILGTFEASLPALNLDAEICFIYKNVKMRP